MYGMSDLVHGFSESVQVTRELFAEPHTNFGRCVKQGVVGSGVPSPQQTIRIFAADSAPPIDRLTLLPADGVCTDMAFKIIRRTTRRLQTARSVREQAGVPY